MNIKTTRTFDKEFNQLPEHIKRRTEKQLVLFMENPQYPSLHIKKMAGYKGIWEGRITYQYRFTFEIIGETFILRRIGTHDILKTP